LPAASVCRARTSFVPWTAVKADVQTPPFREYSTFAPLSIPVTESLPLLVEGIVAAGSMQVLVAVVKLAGGNDAPSVALEPKDFLASDGAALSAWQNVDLLSFRAYSERGDTLLGSKAWRGPQPVFTKLWWQGEGVPRHERQNQ